jgi:hypothetical protein
MTAMSGVRSACKIEVTGQHSTPLFFCACIKPRRMESSLCDLGRDSLYDMAPLVFISCGQFTDREKRLGKAVVAIVKGLGFEPYFAETQSNLNGLHENILNKLNECAGLISIMHDRGKVSGLDGTSYSRGSVWVEQEIAIAAFMTYCLGKNIKVAAFIQNGIKREGIRDLLHLNPFSFSSDEEIVSQLPSVIGEWKLESLAVRLKVSYKKLRGTGEAHDYQLSLEIENPSSVRIREYQLDLSFPSAFLPPTIYTAEVKQRRTNTHRFFRRTERDFPEGKRTIYPQDSKLVFLLDYFVDHDLFYNELAMLQAFEVTLRCGRDEPITQTHPIRDFQTF